MKTILFAATAALTVSAGAALAQNVTPTGPAASPATPYAVTPAVTPNANEEQGYGVEVGRTPWAQHEDGTPVSRVFLFAPADTGEASD